MYYIFIKSNEICIIATTILYIIHLRPIEIRYFAPDHRSGKNQTPEPVVLNMEYLEYSLA